MISNTTQHYADFSDVILAEKYFKTLVKDQLKEYFDFYYQRYQLNYHGSGKKSLTINNTSWLNDVAVETCLRYFVGEKSYLKNVHVFPVFSKSIFNYLADAKICEKLLDLKNPQRAFMLPSQAKLLGWYLERENYIVDQQYILPFLIDEHYTVVVINLVKDHKKFAQIKYYNSFGSDLALEYQQALKMFFKKLGYIPQYENIAQKEQRDKHNCGLFVIYKAIELVSKNVGVILSILPLTMDDKSYYQWFQSAREAIATILLNYGVNIKKTL